MSQPLPPMEPPQWPGPVSYYSEPPNDRALRLIKLVVVFNYISVGLDVCLCLLGIGVGTMFLAFPAMAPRDPGDPPAFVMGAIYLAMGCMAALYAIFKAIGTRKLQVCGRNAWGWGLTAGIIGCAQILCGNCCCLQVAAGVYSIVVLCMLDVRYYLASMQGHHPSNFLS